ncbi:MAG: hypothetical protein FWD06_08695 [Oscillospiraceae bacterium]|nr:hypothetical protein [Oscillospiraceae bacterium]
MAVVIGHAIAAFGAALFSIVGLISQITADAADSVSVVISIVLAVVAVALGGLALWHWIRY